MSRYIIVCTVPLIEIDNTGNVDFSKKVINPVLEYCFRELVIFTMENGYQAVE